GSTERHPTMGLIVKVIDFTTRMFNWSIVIQLMVCGPILIVNGWTVIGYRLNGRTRLSTTLDCVVVTTVPRWSSTAANCPYCTCFRIKHRCSNLHFIAFLIIREGDRVII